MEFELTFEHVDFSFFLSESKTKAGNCCGKCTSYNFVVI